jgi:integrase
MRHSFSTDYLEKTKNPKALQGQLGHRTAEQTNHYAKITDAMKQQGMAEYDRSFSELLVVGENG